MGKTMNPKSILDQAQTYKHQGALNSLKRLAQQTDDKISHVDLWDIRDELIQTKQIEDIINLYPKYHVAISRDVISHDGPEIYFFRKKESMIEFTVKFITDMLEGRYKDEQDYLDRLKEDGENIDEYRGEGFYFFPYAYFGDDVQIKWGSTNEILTLQD